MQAHPDLTAMSQPLKHMAPEKHPRWIALIADWLDEQHLCEAAAVARQCELAVFLDSVVGLVDLKGAGKLCLLPLCQDNGNIPPGGELLTESGPLATRLSSVRRRWFAQQSKLADMALHAPDRWNAGKIVSFAERDKRDWLILARRALEHKARIRYHRATDNEVLGTTSGSSAAPEFRPIAPEDLPRHTD